MNYDLDYLPSDQSETEDMRYGREHEKDAKKKLEQILGVEISPAGKFVDKNNKYLLTVPDGLIGDNKIVQIRCPYKCVRRASLA